MSGTAKVVYVMPGSGPRINYYDLAKGIAIYPKLQAGGGRDYPLNFVEAWQHSGQAVGQMCGELILEGIERKRGVENFLGLADIRGLAIWASGWQDLWSALQLGPNDILGFPKSVIKDEDGFLTMPSLVQRAVQTGKGPAPYFEPIINQRIAAFAVRLNGNNRFGSNLKFARLKS
jgi:hypothetical protein